MTDIEVRTEPLTYERYGPHSYVRDRILALARNDASAIARLQRHAKEMDVELKQLENRARASLDAAEIEYRANPDRTAGQGGYFAPPLWMNQAFATAPRAERVLAKMMPSFPLPAGVQSINLPRITTGTQTQAEPDLDADAERDVIDASVTSPVVTISGMGDVALQLLEQSPTGAHVDWAWFKDLSEDYDTQLGQQLYNGSGTNGTFTGLRNISGINTATYTSATPVFSQSTTPSNNMFNSLGAAAAQIGDKRLRRPEAWLMTTSRWMWIATSVDSQGRPIVPPDLAPPPPFTDGGPDPVSSIGGWPVYVDDNIPVNLGTGANQDLVICCRPSDLMLFESAPRMMVATEVLSGTLVARLRLHRYCAAILGRYPTGISQVTGTGMAVQPGY